ncbi:MAG: CHAT domain-containing protein, partial [Deltaproteobacteria bacterium]
CGGVEADVCVARADIGAGFVDVATGDPVGARQAFTSAWSAVAKRALSRDEAQALWGLTVAHRALGEHASAATSCDRALAIARRINDRPLLAGLHALRGELALDAGEHAAALAHLEAAHEHFAAMRSVPGIASSRLVLARLALARERQVEARIHAVTARDAYLKMGDADGLVAADRVLADISAAKGGHAEEERWLTDALGRGPSASDAMALWSRLGVLARVDGRLDDAEQRFAHAVEQADRVPPGRGLGGGRDAVSAARLAAYDDLLRAVVERRPEAVDDALEISERSVARAFMDVLERVRLQRDNPRVAGLLEELEAIDREEQALVETPDRDETPRRVRALADRRARVEQALLGLSPRWLSPSAPESGRRITRAVTRARDELDGGVVVLKYHLADPASYAFVIAPEGTTLVRLAGRAELAEVVRQFADTLAQPSVTAAQRGLQRRLGRVLFDALVAPVEQAIGARRRLVVIPHLELRLVPFDALVLPDRGAAPAERKLARAAKTPAYLLFRYTVSYAPSLAALAELNDDARRRATHPRYPFVAFADPIYTGKAADLPRLTRAGGEVETANAHVAAGPVTPGTLFLREEATEERLKRLALSRYRIVHLATHGFAPDSVTRDQQPALFLGASEGDDGILRLDEVLDLRLDADLVVLSACSSGRGSLDPGDGLGGLTQAFLYAGSSSVMATLWAVEDRHAAEMMDVFYGRMAAGAPTSEALRAARIAQVTGSGTAADAALGTLRGIGGIVDPDGDAPRPPRGRPAPRYRSADPFFWASYILVGESGDILR